MANGQSATGGTTLRVESLESREMMSWGSVPPAVLPSGGDRFTITRNAADGVYRDTGTISRGEVDSYKFVAQRTGAYTFEAGAAGTASRIDTVVALYDAADRRLDYNDDSGGTKNSKFTEPLVAGRTYTVALSRHNTSQNGLYNLKITPPSISNSASTALGRIYTSGDATLSGTTLTVNLYGQTRTTFDRTLHYFSVLILDRSGQAIHTGIYYDSFTTAGSLIPGTPSARNKTWNFNVANLDLTNASSIKITVGYSTY